MTAEVGEGQQRGFKAAGTGFMVAGSLIGAVGAYVFQAYGARAVGPDGFAPVSVLWTVFFILATLLLVPVEQYVTREVASGRKAIPHDLKAATVMAVIGALLGGAFVWFSLDDWFEGDPQYVAQIALLMVGYALLFTGKGVLAGSRRFTEVGWVMVVETIVRLLIGVLVIQVALGASALGWAMVAGGFSALALRWWRRDTGERRATHDPAARFLWGYVGGTASSQILLAAAPIAVAVLGGSPALISITFVTFTLFRAPMTLIFALQGRLLPYLVGLARDRDTAQLSRIARTVVFGGMALAGLGGVVGWFVGPEVVALLYGDQFMPSSLVAMLAASGVMAAAAAQITSQVLVAEGRTGTLSMAWFGGLVVGVLILVLVGGAVESRVATAFASGEFAALGLMGVLATRR